MHVLFLEARAHGAGQRSVQKVLCDAELSTHDWGDLGVVRHDVGGLQSLLTAVTAACYTHKFYI